MNILKTTIPFLLYAINLNSYAVTDQIAMAEHFLIQDDAQAEARNIYKDGMIDSHPSNNTILRLPTEFSESAFASNNKNNDHYKSLDISGDIKLSIGTRSKAISILNDSLGFKPSDTIDQNLIDYVHQKQQEYDLNITNTIDKNTWQAIYPQSLGWQVKTVLNDLSQWDKIIEQQTHEKDSGKFIVVNMPNMLIYGYEWDSEKQEAEIVFKTRAVIGSLAHKTPTDFMRLWAIKYNPTWTPTPNIVKRTVLKQGQINHQWLNRNNIQVVDKNGLIINHNDITPDNYQSFRYTQPSGDENSMGVLKFETTSGKNIYLHDTNTKNLFNHNVRAYSAGCIRVDDFIGFSSWVSDQTHREVEDKLLNKKTRTIKTPTAIPIYITNTQSNFDDNKPLFSIDVYGKNKGNSIIIK